MSAEEMLGKLEAERDDLRKQLIATQEMLGIVLMTVGQDVPVQKSELQKGVPQGTQIKIEDAGPAFIFGIELPEGESNE